MKTLGHPIILGLPDVAADLLAFGGQLATMKEPTDADTFRRQVQGLLAEFETRGKEAGADSVDIDTAKYALVALIDENILTSKWAIKDSWMGKPLQMEIWNSFEAGEKFYTRLDELKASDSPAKLPVLEVYYLCMALGFRGKYGGFDGMEKQKVLMQEVAARIRKLRPGGADRLSPSWEEDGDVGQIVKEFPTWVISVACGGVVLVVYIVLRAILGASAGGV